MNVVSLYYVRGFNHRTEAICLGEFCVPRCALLFKKMSFDSEGTVTDPVLWLRPRRSHPRRENLSRRESLKFFPGEAGNDFLIEAPTTPLAPKDDPPCPCL
jgi:hypothetical protein